MFNSLQYVSASELDPVLGEKFVSEALEIILGVCSRMPDDYEGDLEVTLGEIQDLCGLQKSWKEELMRRMEPVHQRLQAHEFITYNGTRLRLSDFEFCIDVLKNEWVGLLPFATNVAKELTKAAAGRLAMQLTNGRFKSSYVDKSA